MSSALQGRKLAGRIKPGYAKEHRSFTVNSNPDRAASVPTPADGYPLLCRLFLSIRGGDPTFQTEFDSMLETMGEPISVSQPSKEFLGPYILQTMALFAGMRLSGAVAGAHAGAALAGHAVLGDSGENLAVVLKALCSDAERKDVLTAWLRELTPMDVRDLRFPRDPSGRVHLQILEGNEERYPPIAPRTAPSGSSPCWPCCSATPPRACISSRRSTRHSSGRASRSCWN